MEQGKEELVAELLAALFCRPAWTAAKEGRPRCGECGERHEEDAREFCEEAQFEKRRDG
jgi:hypothetical protein